MSHLKLVPKRAPGSLTPEERLLLLKGGDPNGPIRLECWPARPYLWVVRSASPEPDGEADVERPPEPGQA